MDPLILIFLIFIGIVVLIVLFNVNTYIKLLIQKLKKEMDID